MKFLKWFLLILFLLIVAGVISAGILAEKVCDKVPMALDHNYLRRAREKEPFIPFHVMKKGQNNYDLIRRSGPDHVATIRYDDDEFNYILRTLLYSNLLNQAGMTGGRRISAKRTSLILKNGVFHLKQIMDIPHNPFGKYINLHIIFKISVRDGKETVEILSARAGTFEIPKSVTEEKLKEIVAAHYRGTSSEKFIQEAVRDLHTDEQGIFMEYRPYSFRRNLKKMSGGPAGIFFGRSGRNYGK